MWDQTVKNKVFMWVKGRKRVKFLLWLLHTKSLWSGKSIKRVKSGKSHNLEHFQLSCMRSAAQRRFGPAGSYNHSKWPDGNDVSHRNTLSVQVFNTNELQNRCFYPQLCTQLQKQTAHFTQKLGNLPLFALLSLSIRGQVWTIYVQTACKKTVSCFDPTQSQLYSL